MSDDGKTTGRSGCGCKGWDGREEKMRGDVTSTSASAVCTARFHETNSMGTPSYVTIITTAFNSSYE